MKIRRRPTKKKKKKNFGRRDGIRPVDRLLAVQVRQSPEDVQGEVANDRLGDGPAVLPDVFIYRAGINVLQVYVESVADLQWQRERVNGSFRSGQRDRPERRQGKFSHDLAPVILHDVPVLQLAQDLDLLK